MQLSTLAAASQNRNVEVRRGLKRLSTIENFEDMFSQMNNQFQAFSLKHKAELEARSGRAEKGG